MFYIFFQGSQPAKNISSIYILIWQPVYDMAYLMGQSLECIIRIFLIYPDILLSFFGKSLDLIISLVVFIFEFSKKLFSIGSISNCVCFNYRAYKDVCPYFYLASIVFKYSHTLGAKPFLYDIWIFPLINIFCQFN